MRSEFFGADGAIHIAMQGNKAPRLDHSPKLVEKMNRERKICLTCTKKKCNGYCENFSKRGKKQ